ncbi:hypothetical protein [Burkholderia multivorans]|uniref:hypothetical protein n=1 Tax=Burkholderia multivorans TaxID=87883 RepID=UPI00143E3CBF|nr:hypothetical protein [Burkholderia multivorans]QIX17328.1 hypothetical protein FOB32_17155 [Burkholderia multivorans]
MRFTTIALIVAAISLSACDDKPAAPQASTPEPVAKPALTEQQRADLIAKATHGMEVNRDKMEKVSFYTPRIPLEEWANQPLGVYLSIPDGYRVIFRVHPHYTGSDWIFFQKIKVMADDQIVYEREFPYADMVRTNSYGSVYESTDYAAKDADIEAMRKIAAAKSVTVRLSGRENQRDYEMSKADQQRIAQALKAYDELQPLSS